MLEHLVGNARGERDNLGAGARLDLDADKIQRLDVVEAEAIGGRGAEAFARAAERFKDMQQRRPKAAGDEIVRDRCRRRGIGREHEQAAMRLERRRERMDRPAAKRERGNIVERPAKPRASKRERGWRRQADRL